MVVEDFCTALNMYIGHIKHIKPDGTHWHLVKTNQITKSFDSCSSSPNGQDSPSSQQDHLQLWRDLPQTRAQLVHHPSVQRLPPEQHHSAANRTAALQHQQLSESSKRDQSELQLHRRHSLKQQNSQLVEPRGDRWGEWNHNRPWEV